MFAVMPGVNNTMILRRISSRILEICPNTELNRIAPGQYGGSSGSNEWHASRRIPAVPSTKSLEVARLLELESKIHQKVGTPDHVDSKDEQHARLRAPTEKEQRIREDVD